MWLTRRPTIAVLLCGVFVHAVVLTVVFARTGRIDSFAFDSLDCGEFYRIAQNVAGHATFSQGDQPPLAPDTWRTPGYPLFLAAFMCVVGDSPTVLVVGQQLLSILNVLLLFRLARCWMSERRAMIVAALFLLEPYHLKYSLWLMSTTLFVTVLLLVWHTWKRTVHTRRCVWIALLGGLCGFLILVRPVGALIPLAVFVGLIVDIWRRSPGASTRARWPGQALLPVVFVAACFVVVGSWMLRNSRIAGHFALSDQEGVVLAYFKATEVILWREGRSQDRYLETTLDPDRADHPPAEGRLPHSVWEEIDAELRQRLLHLPREQRTTLRWQNLAQGIKTPADSFLVSRTLAGIARSHLVQSPVNTAACCAVRCGSILTFPLCLAIKPPTGVEISRAGSLAKGVVYLLLCTAVLVRLVRGKITFATAFFPIACTVALLFATTPQLDPRFRVPMIPLLLVLVFLPLRRDGTATGDLRSRQRQDALQEPQ